MIHWMTDDVRNDSRRSLSFGISETELANISNSYLLVSTDWSLIMLKETDGANWFQ